MVREFSWPEFAPVQGDLPRVETSAIVDGDAINVVEATVPVFHEAAPDAKQRLVKVSKGYQQRQSYRDNLSRVADGKMLEVEPEEGESLRKLKVNVRRAANEMELSVEYGDTVDGRLLVWPEPARERSGRRGRPRKNAGSGE